MVATPAKTSLFAGIGGWLMSAAFNFIGGPSWFGWFLAVCGSVFLIAAAYYWEPIHSRLPDVLKQDEFTVRITGEDSEVFSPAISLVAARIRVSNHTGHVKQVRSVGVTARTPMPGSLADDKVTQAKARMEERYGRWTSRVEPHDHINLWRVFALNRPLEGGRPAYEVSVRDELENDFRYTRKARKGRQYVAGENL